MLRLNLIAAAIDQTELTVKCQSMVPKPNRHGEARVCGDLRLGARGKQSGI